MMNRNFGGLMLLVLVAAIYVGVGARRGESQTPSAEAAPAAAATLGEGSVREITLVNVKYEGTNVWVPGPIVCKKGDKVKLRLINNVKDDPAEHGLAIPEFGVQVVVKRGEPANAEFEATKAGIFKVACHLHLPHVGTQIVVLE